MNTRKFLIHVILMVVALSMGIGQACAQTGPNPAVDYSKPNYANSPILRKFVDSLPGLGAANSNNLGQYIPVAIPDTTTYPGSDYYKIGLVDYTEQMHSDLPATKLRGYRDLAAGADPKAHYLGPLIVAQRDRAVRILFTNMLATGEAGNLFLPVDTTLMGAGTGPSNAVENYTQNRATLHLHGGFTPWLSDGTPHQWTAPANETTSYKKGVSTQKVPDMPDPGDGAMTFYYPNQQSARLQFYHDHALGMTRLNVYAGEAAGYLIQDKVEESLINSGIIPDSANEIPLIIQDKTFVPDAVTLAAKDPLWNTEHWGGMGSLWFPHVYMPNQDPTSPDGANPYGRWDYGPWFWPIFPASEELPAISAVPESFMDTPVVNGTAYPYFTVEPKAYRFRVLNGCNDRYLNLQLYYADPTNINGTEVAMCPAAPTEGWPDTWPTDGRAGGVPDPTLAGPNIIQIGTEGGFLPDSVVLTNTPIGYQYNRRDITVLDVTTHTLYLGPAERADIIIDFSQVPPGSKLILYNDAPAPNAGFDPRYDYYTGDPDMTSFGGAPTTLAGYGPNTRTIMQFRVAGSWSRPYNLAALTNALNKAFKASQEDLLVPEGIYSRIQDTSLNVSGLPKSLASIHLTAVGSGYTTNPTVTISGGGGINATATATVTAGAVTSVQLVNPGSGYTFAPDIGLIGGGGAGAVAIANLVDATPMQPKTIQELFDTHGRMNATLGVEVPFTSAFNQTTIPYGYIDPITETIPMGATQLWKITHNGVDTHAMHFHLVNVQLINRVGWDGMIKPPEPNERGWKETIKMRALEDAIVAMRPAAPMLPFAITNSVRPLDVTAPLGSTTGFTGVDTNGNRIAVSNVITDFGWEYVWHCHLLGHEENDMMRPLVMTGATNYIGETNYIAPAYLSLNIQPDVARGSIVANPAPGVGPYVSGTVVTLTAVRNVPFRFMSFSGDASGTSATVQVTMDTFKSVTANFAPPLARLFWQSPYEQILNSLMNTDGSFNSTTEVAADITPWQIRAAGDIDRDGTADLIAQGPYGQVACVFMNADGTYRSTTLTIADQTPWQICAAGDIDGDGIADLILQGPYGQVCCVFMNANGTYRSTTLTIADQTPWQICAAGDIDRDGVADLIAQAPYGQVCCVFMNADGTYRSTTLIIADITPWQICAAGDIDGDGIADLIAQAPYGQVACLFMNITGTIKSVTLLYPDSTDWQIRAAGY